MPRYDGVLLDIGGVLFVGDEAIPGSVEAVGRLREAGVGVRFLTNTTSKPRLALVGKLRRLGLTVEPEEIFTPALAARERLGGRPAHCLVRPSLREDLGELAEGEPEVVVVGDAGEGFSYGALNEAFRHLENGAALLALARNQAYQAGDGAPSLDAGPFVAALEFAADREAELVGKPARAFFEAARASLGTKAGRTLMVGDDVEGDVAGAFGAGLDGVLVRSGKYKQGDEDRIEREPTAVHDDLAATVDWVLTD